MKGSKDKRQHANFRGNPLYHYKTTLVEQLNGEKNDEKWDGELIHLSGFGWAMFFCVCVQCLEDCWNIFCSMDQFPWHLPHVSSRHTERSLSMFLMNLSPVSITPFDVWRFPSLAEAATSIMFVATNTCLSRQNTSFVETKVCLSRQKNCHDKNILLQQIFVATNIIKLTRVCRYKTFVATKMILVAASANDRFRSWFRLLNTRDVWRLLPVV